MPHHHPQLVLKAPPLPPAHRVASHRLLYRPALQTICALAVHDLSFEPSLIPVAANSTLPSLRPARFPLADPGTWGHEYIRHLAAEPGDKYTFRETEADVPTLTPVPEAGKEESPAELKIIGTIEDLSSFRTSPTTTRQWRSRVWRHSRSSLGIMIAMSEDVGAEMSLQQFHDLISFTANLSCSFINLILVPNPQLSILDTLSKYSHDNNLAVALNTIFCHGCSRCRNRLVQMLRQLAGYCKEPDCHFIMQITEGLVHIGKGTIGLNQSHVFVVLL
ncbi:hypothetical protein B0H14DRAFT_3427902 [Mycena olivaceomarginata]|nr:hypothetical protein B0H14DRAFT_3427902 [Mycena olivaceomarginata]